MTQKTLVEFVNLEVNNVKESERIVNKFESECDKSWGMIKGEWHTNVLVIKHPNITWEVDRGIMMDGTQQYRISEMCKY